MDPERFQNLVDEAVARLPDEFARRLDNVDVVVATRPSRETLRRMGLEPGRGTLLGLYHGVPQTRRTTRYGNVGPDQIVIYREPVVAAAADAVADGDDADLDAAVRDQVRRTVLHEIGHHFGLGEADLRRLEDG